MSVKHTETGPLYVFSSIQCVFSSICICFHHVIRESDHSFLEPVVSGFQHFVRNNGTFFYFRHLSDLEIYFRTHFHDGFERLAMETIPNDSKFKRRAWITYKDQVNIRDVSWNLNNIRLKDCELGTVAEKPLELKDRIRNVPGLSNHGPIAFRDLKMAISCCEKKDAHMAKIDESAKVAHKESAADESGDVPEEDEPVPEFWGENSNPVLNAAKKFVEQHNEMYEERIAEMLKKPEDKKAKIAKIENQDGEIKTEVAEDENDEDLIEIDCIDDIFGVLDPLLAYLRIVHYIDFYNQSDYHSFEDEHPYRVGACHVRGGIPSRGVSAETARDFTLKFEEKITTNLLKCDGLQLDDEQSAELGLKSIDDEIEAFLAINTQQLDAEKYLCPLSNKKFKGKEYVRKHIFNKHGDKVDAVRGDVNYFNNYVRDSNKDGPLEPRYRAFILRFTGELTHSRRVFKLLN